MPQNPQRTPSIDALGGMRRRFVRGAIVSVSALCLSATMMGAVISPAYAEEAPEAAYTMTDDGYIFTDVEGVSAPSVEAPEVSTPEPVAVDGSDKAVVREGISALTETMVANAIERLSDVGLGTPETQAPVEEVAVEEAAPVVEEELVSPEAEAPAEPAVIQTSDGVRIINNNGLTDPASELGLVQQTADTSNIGKTADGNIVFGITGAMSIAMGAIIYALIRKKRGVQRR